MEAFLADYDEGKIAGRYVEGELPTLPFPSRSFDVAVCSHFLFLYSDQLGEAFHLEAVQDLCRVAREVRIFPLLALGSQPSPYVDTVGQAARNSGCNVSLEMVPYEFQRGGNQMMRIRG
jgi:SAM-dependent methyltransferase